MVLHTIAATQKVPRHTRLDLRGSTRVPATSRAAPFPSPNSRGITRVPPSSRGALFPPPSWRGGIFPCVVGKEFPVFPSHLKRRRSPQERREELQGRAIIPRDPQMSQCFPCTASTFKPRIDSHHGGMWDSPVGKPRGKATDPLIHAKGSVTLLLQLERKAHVQAPT